MNNLFVFYIIDVEELITDKLNTNRRKLQFKNQDNKIYSCKGTGVHAHIYEIFSFSFILNLVSASSLIIILIASAPTLIKICMNVLKLKA